MESVLSSTQQGEKENQNDNTLELRYDKGPGQGRQNFIRNNEFSLDRGLFFIWGKENSLLYRGHRYIEVPRQRVAFTDDKIELPH